MCEIIERVTVLAGPKPQHFLLAKFSNILRPLSNIQFALQAYTFLCRMVTKILIWVHFNISELFLFVRTAMSNYISKRNMTNNVLKVRKFNTNFVVSTTFLCARSMIVVLLSICNFSSINIVNTSLLFTYFSKHSNLLKPILFFLGLSRSSAIFA